MNGLEILVNRVDIDCNREEEKKVLSIMSDCCNCCGFTSLIGVVFFGITAVMVKRENPVFLSHKAGLNLHTITDEQINEKFMVMIYTSIVSSQSSKIFLPTFFLESRIKLNQNGDRCEAQFHSHFHDKLVIFFRALAHCI